MNVGNPLTKDKYDVGDRIIAKLEIVGIVGNYSGTVKNGLTEGIYNIFYDNGRELPTEPNQILGLTESKISNREIPDAQLNRWLPQKIS